MMKYSCFIATICFAFCTVANELETRASTCSVITPTPSGSVCGTHGSLNSSASAFAQSQYVDSFDTCRSWCLARRNPVGYTGGCKSFGYNETSKLCSFYDTTVSQAFTPSNTTAEYWDRTCYNCPPLTCPQPTGVNLIDDGNFEDSNMYYGPWSNSYTKVGLYGKVGHPGLNSKNSWKCNANAYCTLSQQILLCFQGLYSVSFDYMIQAGPSSSMVATAGDAFYDRSYGSNGTNGQWVHAEFSFVNLYQLETLVLQWDSSCLQECPNYYIFIDNVTMYPLSEPIPTVAGSEIAWTNPGFETGKLAPWQFEQVTGAGKHSIVSPGLSGSKYAFYYEGNVKETYNNAQLQQTLPKLVTNESYVLKFEYNMTGQIYFDVSIAGGIWSESQDGSAGGTINYTYVPPQNQLTTFERSFMVINANSNTFTLNALKENYTSGTDHPETLYLDNFSIAKAK